MNIELSFINTIENFFLNINPIILTISTILLFISTIILICETKKLTVAVYKSVELAKISARISDFYGYKVLLDRLIVIKNEMTNVQCNFLRNNLLNFPNENEECRNYLNRIINKYANIITSVYRMTIIRLNPNIASDFENLELDFSKLMLPLDPNNFSDFKNALEDMDKVLENLQNKLKKTIDDEL